MKFDHYWSLTVGLARTPAGAVREHGLTPQTDLEAWLIQREVEAARVGVHLDEPWNRGLVADVLQQALDHAACMMALSAVNAARTAEGLALLELDQLTGEILYELRAAAARADDGALFSACCRALEVVP